MGDTSARSSRSRCASTCSAACATRVRCHSLTLIAIALPLLRALSLGCSLGSCTRGYSRLNSRALLRVCMCLPYRPSVVCPCSSYYTIPRLCSYPGEVPHPGACKGQTKQDSRVDDLWYQPAAVRARAAALPISEATSAGDFVFGSMTAEVVLAQMPRAVRPSSIGHHRTATPLRSHSTSVLRALAFSTPV